MYLNILKCRPILVPTTSSVEYDAIIIKVKCVPLYKKWQLKHCLETKDVGLVGFFKFDYHNDCRLLE